MENKSKDTLKKIQFNSHTRLTCIETIEEMNIIACGDIKGRILCFDIREHKPIVKLINTGINSQINHISYCNNDLYFSCNNEILSTNLIAINNKKIIPSKDINHLIKSKDDIIEFSITMNTNSNEPTSLVYNNQEEDKFYFFTKESSTVDSFLLSSAYGQCFIDKTSYILLYSFEGEIIQYDYINHLTKNSKQIKNFYNAYPSEDIDGNISNPPYLSKIIYNPYNNEILCGMMDGVVISMTAIALKKKNVKTIHNGSISDMKISKFPIKEQTSILSYGNDHCLKLFNAKTFDIDYYFDIDGTTIIDFDSDKDYHLYYVDNTNECLNMIQFKQ